MFAQTRNTPAQISPGANESLSLEAMGLLPPNVSGPQRAGRAGVPSHPELPGVDVRGKINPSRALEPQGQHV